MLVQNEGPRDARKPTAEMTNFSDEEISRQLQLGEDSVWEFKQIQFSGHRPRQPRPDDLADEIAAFANSDGGILLCGVTDQGDVQGMSRKQMDSLVHVLGEICSDKIKPPLTATIRRWVLVDGKPFVLVEVPRGEAQHESPGGSFRRLGSSKRRMTSDERLRLAQRRGQARFLWFDQKPVSNTGFGTLDEALWKLLLSARGRADPAVSLEKMGLLARDDAGVVRASVTGLLMCSARPDEWLGNACITATQYRGLDRASGQLDAQVITGPLNRQIAEAVAFVMRNMRVGAHKMPARIDLPQYSDRAIFEAIVNAVVHRDYSIRGSRIRLSMFADRLEISSPGALPNGMTVENMATRQSTRNETLASVLGRMRAGGIPGSRGRYYFMERRGDGIPIIWSETRTLSGKSPGRELIDETELRLTIPAAATEATPADTVITVRHQGDPVPGVDLLVLFPNKTWVEATTDGEGEARVRLHTTHLPMTVFAAADGLEATVLYNWRPAERALALELKALQRGGSVIFPEGVGELPGLEGRLNPIRDTLDRTYLYASNIAINEGQAQPVQFQLGETLRLTDARGRELLANIYEIVGRSALVEYKAIEGEGGRIS